MKFCFNLTILKHDTEENVIGKREPTKKEIKDFLLQFAEIMDAEGDSWIINENDDGYEEYDFNPKPENVPNPEMLTDLWQRKWWL